MTVGSPAVVGNTFLLSLHVNNFSFKSAFIVLISLNVDPDDNELNVMTYIGPKGTVPSGSIKGLREGQWYEVVISQEKQLVNELTNMTN